MITTTVINVESYSTSTQKVFYNANSKTKKVLSSLITAIEQSESDHPMSESELIVGLCELAETRDPETRGHMERMRLMASQIAFILAEMPKFNFIEPEFVRTIFNYSPLHDIGKIGIPDSVLLKPGKLSPEEFEIIKNHTILGGKTLDAICQKSPTNHHLRIGRDIAYDHHEKYDGSGYPFGKKDGEISLAGRIVSLADAYDTITSRRCYKEASSHDEAREIIKKDSGSHFDPDMVESFLRSENEFLAIKEVYAS